MSDESFGEDQEPAVTGYSSTAITLPEFRQWDGKKIYDYSEQIADYTSLEELGLAISKARIGLFKLTENINHFERLEREAKLNYDRSYRREYLASTEKTETAKRARAELKCEELENEWVKNDQMKSELVRMSYTMRAELQTLQTIANNLRQQLKQY